MAIASHWWHVGCFRKAGYFTTLDFKIVDWQLLLREKDKEKTDFGCHRGLFEYNIIVFGVMNGPSTFQQLMSVVLHELGDFAMAYLDDIFIFNKP